MISVYVSRIQCDGAIGILNGLISFLEILRVDDSQLPVRLGIARVRLNRVFEDINCLRKILLAYEQAGNTRGEFRLTRIDIEHLPICLQRLIHLAVLFECHAFHKVCQRPSLTLPLWTQRKISGRLEIDEVILWVGFDWGCRRASRRQ